MGKLLAIGCLFETFRMFVGATSSIYLVDDKGFLESEIAALRSFQFTVIVLLDIPLSYIADKRSRKASIVLAIFCFSMALDYSFS